jgi:hypothetical protein
MLKRIKISLVILFVYFMFVQQPAYVSGVDGCKQCYKNCARDYERNMKLCGLIKNSIGRTFCEYTAERSRQQCEIMCENV